ncbi:PKD domain-containing protein [Gracilimonas sp. Q87]|uniref:PKD domain-containing protein n=1 Tax=Gracilimonas sp. Q87 TaxID=3384766 RepID=UPI003983F419
MTKFFYRTLLLISAFVLFAPALPAQDLFVAVSGNQSDHAMQTIDLWIQPEDGASQGTLQIFDAATGSKIDLLSGNANTLTSFELYNFNDLYRLADRQPVKRNTPGNPLKSIEVQNEASYSNSWQNLSDITETQNGYILRVSVVSGNDLNNFKVRVLSPSGTQSTNWTLLSIDLSVSVSGLTNSRSLQVKPYITSTENDGLILNSSNDMRINFLDRFGRFYELDGSAIPESAFDTQNEWVLSVGGNEQAFTVFSLISADQPKTWHLDPVLTPFQDPQITLQQRPTQTCSEKSFELTSPFLNSANFRNTRWQVNGETRATGAGPSLLFQSRGEVDLTIRVPNTIFSFPEEWIINRTVQINEPPIARLNVAKTDIALSEVLTLSASDSYDMQGKPLNFFWFVNGELQATSPSFNFSTTQPGTYIISVRVNNGGDIPNCSNSQRQVRIEVSNKTQVTDPDGGSGRQIVAPNITSTGKISLTYNNGDNPLPSNFNYTWNMGDGTILNGINADHTYQEPGTYEVTLTIDDGRGRANSAQVRTHTVIVNEFPEAVFEVSDIIPSKVPFRLDGTASFDEDGIITRYEWFLDGQSFAAGPNPEVVINEPGEHVITLKVQDNSGNEIAQSLTSRTVWANHAPVIRWEVSPDEIGQGEEITLNAGGTYDPDGEIQRIEWTFEDGRTFQGQEVKVSFQESGVHYFTITAVDNQGIANSEKTVEGTINVNHAPYIVTESVIRSNSLDVTLDATSTYDADDDPLSFEWTLPDGSKRTESSFSWKAPEFGVHIFNLKVNDGTGLENSSAEKTIRVLINRPVQAVADSVVISCAGQTILFNSSQSYDPDGDPFDVQWDFGNGDSSESANPSYVYDRPGIYDAILSMTDGISNKTTVTKIPVIIEGSPVAKMNVTDTTVCVDTALEFDGSNSVDPSGALPSLLWDFGDGTIESGPKIRHVFTEAGIFPVTLTVEGSGSVNCGNTNQTRAVVRVIEGPKARYEVPEWIEPGETVRLDGSNSSAEEELNVVEWQIQKDDSLIEKSGFIADHRFNEPGEYLVTLNLQTGSNATCNSASLTRSIRVNAPPVIEWELPEKAAAGSDIELNAMNSYDPDGYIKEYKWFLDDELISKNAAELIKAIEPGPHTVRLEITDNSPTTNNRAIAEKTFIANNSPKPEIRTSRAGYIGEPITLFASPDRDADGQAVTNTWLVDHQPLNGNVFTPTEARKHRITLLQDDLQNAPNSVDSAIVEITPKNIPEIYPRYPKAIISGYSLTTEELGISSDWRFQNGTAYRSSWTARETGEQELRIYWFYENEPIYYRAFPINIKPALSFEQTQSTIQADFTPANPEKIIDAPALNRSAKEVRFTWFTEDGQIVGYGPQTELALSEGENRFKVIAEDIDTKGSQAAETVLIVIAE